MTITSSYLGQSFPNDAITDEGYHLLIHAMRHAWAADELDDAGREEALAVALGTSDT